MGAHRCSRWCFSRSTIALLAIVLFVPAIAAAPADPWSSMLVKRGIDPALVENPVAVTPSIRAAAEAITGGTGNTVEQLKHLQAALFDARRFTFDYEAGLTETASQALASRRGNCVAFTNLFIAMARARGLRIQAGYLAPHTNGERRGDLVYLATHVVAVYPLHDRYVVFDFYRLREDVKPRIRLLDDYELTALYLNNRAVEALGAGDYALAENRFDAVLKLAPEFAAAYGNLGVLRRRRGDVPGALEAYRHALALDPRDPSVLGNLAALYVGMGREREAQTALSLADLSRASPYTFLARGDLEAATGRPEVALGYYRRAAGLDRRIADPHVAMARLALACGRRDEALRDAQRAIALDPGNREAVTILNELGSGATP